MPNILEIWKLAFVYFVGFYCFWFQSGHLGHQYKNVFWNIVVWGLYIGSLMEHKRYYQTFINQISSTQTEKKFTKAVNALSFCSSLVTI